MIEKLVTFVTTLQNAELKVRLRWFWFLSVFAAVFVLFVGYTLFDASVKSVVVAAPEEGVAQQAGALRVAGSAAYGIFERIIRGGGNIVGVFKRFMGSTNDIIIQPGSVEAPRFIPKDLAPIPKTPLSQ